MTPQPEDVIRPELSPSEQLLWTGRPPQGFRLTPFDWVLIPFSLLWGGMVIYGASTLVWQNEGVGPLLVAFVLVAAALFVIFGRFGVDAQARAKTFYGVTSERVILVGGMFHRTVKSVNLDTLSDLTLTESSRAGGTIAFGTIPPWYLWYGGSGFPGTGPTAFPTFDLKENAKAVYELVRTAQRKARQEAASRVS